ncbi:MAG: ABC transporter ATP-binding protein [Armatimonadota bacterium]|nr:ABC transporter ATP-binding protein [Armatimonadota bacterium]MDR7436123.1 ABC transporter ATP-binding protein [Armatimonadota bacterium]MDR7472002.1 ABC transporter ATP-binding protein [Armatimonadota bacterium]MDR7506714.1 ABC transporter ATP-binding protein [Armatimonadota bacterium]MDR7508658.1 ABC transporter ATP-binding protein [Armatimonadota bacterium]
MAVPLALVGVVKYYGHVLGVGPVSLEVAPGEFVSLLGPSGCGKTTTLRLIAGLERPTAGAIRIGEEDVTGVPSYRRNIGLVFQNYALFPHLSVFDNVAFGLRYRGVTGAEARRRVAEALELVGLVGYEQRLPRQLSGGQQQRVALARAVVINPRILLLDEPLSNLDLALRQRMQAEIKRIQRELGITTVYVTHDQTEAFGLSDRIAVLFHGRVHQYARPDELYERPATPEVADFIGETNTLNGRLRRDHGRVVFTTSRGTELVVSPEHVPAGEESVRLFIRPHRVRFFPPGADVEGPNLFEATVERLIFGGDVLRATVRLRQGDVVQISAHNRQETRTALQQGSLRIQLLPEDLQVFPSKGKEADRVSVR